MATRTVTAAGATIGFTAKFLESWAGQPTGASQAHVLNFVDYNFEVGTGTGKVNLGPYIASETLGTSASTTYDLTSYANGAGATITTMTKLKALVIKNTGTVDIEIGGAAATQVIGSGFLKDGTDIIVLPAGEVLQIMSRVGITISASIKSLKVLNTSGATAATYDIFWIGSTA